MKAATATTPGFKFVSNLFIILFIHKSCSLTVIWFFCSDIFHFAHHAYREKLCWRLNKFLEGRERNMLRCAHSKTGGCWLRLLFRRKHTHLRLWGDQSHEWPAATGGPILPQWSTRKRLQLYLRFTWKLQGVDCSGAQGRNTTSILHCWVAWFLLHSAFPLPKCSSLSLVVLSPLALSGLFRVATIPLSF